MHTVDPEKRDSLLALARPGIEGIQRNWGVMVILQVVALLCVIGFYHVPVVTRACATLSDVRQAGGLLGAAIATAVAGLVLPKLVRLLLRQPLGESDVGLAHELMFLFALFAINGVMVDVFYRLLAVWFGDDGQVATVAKKVLVDQLVFTPVVSLPFIALCFTIRDHRYAIGKVIRELGARWYLRRVVTLMLPGWCYWTPMVTLIYSLPGPLQFVLFSLAMAAWSVVMVFIGESARQRQGVALAE